jgi:hypothetical protein
MFSPEVYRYQKSVADLTPCQAFHSKFLFPAQSKTFPQPSSLQTMVKLNKTDKQPINEKH